MPSDPTESPEITAAQPPADAAVPARPKGRRPAGWALGLPALVLLAVVAILQIGPSIEHDIRRTLLRSGPEGPIPLARYRARAEVDGRDVAIVADLGLSDEARREVEAGVRAVPGVRTVRTEVATPVAMTPFTFTAKRGPSGLTLGGGTPSAELRAEIMRGAMAIAAPDSIDDRLRLGTGAPTGFDAAARAAMAALARVESGEIRIVDRVVEIRATVATSADYDALLAFARAPPPGFVLGNADIVPPEAPAWSWSARLDEGRIDLDGNVPSEAERSELLARIGLAFPGAKIGDRMRTARGLPPGVEFGAMTEVATKGLAALQSGLAVFAGGRFSLTGETVERGRVGEMSDGIRRDLPRGLASAEVRLTVVPAKPFRFSAKRSSGLVVLAGYVPDESARRVALDLARERFPGERVVDRLRVADGAPPDFVAAERLALERLADLQDGEAQLRDSTIRLSGRILYRQLAERVRRTFPGSAPAGWTAEASIETAPVARPLDAAFCQDLLGDSVKREPIRFETGATSPSGQGLAEIADIVGRCGTAQITVTHRIVTPADLGEAQQVASARATAIVKALGERGMPVRLSAAGVATAGKPDARTDFSVEP